MFVCMTVCVGEKETDKGQVLSLISMGLCTFMCQCIRLCTMTVTTFCMCNKLYVWLTSNHHLCGHSSEHVLLFWLCGDGMCMIVSVQE